MTDDRRRALLATGVAAMLATLVRATSAAPLQAGTKREDMPPSPSGTKQEGMPSSRIGTKQDDTPSSQDSRKQRGTSSSPATHRTHAMTSSLHYQNAELVYRTGGQEGAPTIVLLHGRPGLDGRLCPAAATPAAALSDGGDRYARARPFHARRRTVDLRADCR